MDRRERYDNPEETGRLFYEAMQARLWTALPAIVESFDATKMTLEVQPAINAIARSATGEAVSIQLPKLVDVPVVWPGGGGATLTFPIVAGDECLVVFSSRCIDGWWSQGKVMDPPEVRMHNLSDGFAFVGLRSLPRALASISSTNVQLRSDDGATFVELSPTGKTVQITAPNGIDLNGVQISASGVISNASDVQTASGISLKNHVHTGVTAGGANTGAATG